MSAVPEEVIAGGEEPSDAAEPQAGRPKWPKRPPKTEADIAAIAVLDELREAKGETLPSNLPLACIVKVTECLDVPKANEAYAMARVTGPGGASWRLCVRRGTVKVGKNMLFISDNAALPIDDRFRNLDVCKVNEKTYKYGFGVKARRLLPHVKRHIYRLNCGVLYPMDAFPELKGKRAGIVVAALLNIDDAEEMKLRQSLPQGKRGVPQADAMARAQAMLRRMRALASQ